MAQATTVEELIKGAYTREEAAQAILAFEDRDDTPDLRVAKRALTSLPVLTLYVPCALSRMSVRKVGEWARRELDPHTMLEIHVDPQAAGGCLFVWKGVLHDYSLARALDEKRAAYEEKIAHVLAAVL